MRRARLAIPVLALAALLTACGAVSQSSPGTTEGRQAFAGGASGAIAPAPLGAPVAADKAAVTAGLPAAQGIPVPLALDQSRAVIRTGNIALRAKDPWALADRAQSIAVGLGGDVIGLSQSGAGDQRSATLTLRVPSALFTDALRQLRDLDAEVVSSNVDGKDVTEQFVDLQARLSAKQAEEQRYLSLLARAEKIDDILKIDQALASVRTQVEQLTGQINSIKSRTEFSTISVNITTLGVVVPAPVTGWDPGRTADKALGALLSVVRSAADAAIWLLILGWIPGALLGGLYLASRAVRRTA